MLCVVTPALMALSGHPFHTACQTCAARWLSISLSNSCKALDGFLFIIRFFCSCLSFFFSLSLSLFFFLSLSQVFALTRQHWQEEGSPSQQLGASFL